MLRMLWIAVFLFSLAWSAIQPHDWLTWFLEIVPALIGAAALAFTWRSFALTRLLYILILLHCIILMIGGHYTYAEVPLFNDFKLWFGWTRNNYDKLGHFAQGFIPALIVREIIIRKSIIRGSRWQAFFCICFCLAFSAFYELIEWWVALATGEAAEAFLGTQGYVWDTQSDMAWALAGAIASLFTLRRWHDRQLAALPSS
jgi:putative membrane protein